VLASRASAKDIFLYAGKTENKAFAMPAMSYAAFLDSSWTKVKDDLADDVLGFSTFERMSEYGPRTLSQSAASAAADFLARWEQALADLQPVDRDYSGFREPGKMPAGKTGNEDWAAALQRISPVLNLGLDEGTGPLIPTAYLTARDLLGFGWEMTNLLCADYHESLNQPAGDAEAAKRVVAAVAGSIKGASIFFPATGAVTLAPMDTPVRLQHVGSARVQQALLKKLSAGWAAAPETFLKRQWLNKVATREAVAHLIDAKAAEARIKENIERLIRESGPAIAHELSAKEPAPKIAAAIDRAGLAEAIAAELLNVQPVDSNQLKDEMKTLVSAPAPSTGGGGPAVSLDFSKFKTADEFWSALDKFREQPKRVADSPEDYMRRIRTWLESLRAAAEAFVKAYPNDPHRHAAKLLAIDAGLQLGQFGQQHISKLNRDEIEAIVNAPDADETLKGEAGFFLLMVDSQSVSFIAPHTVPPFMQALATYLEKYPKHARSQYVAAMLTQLLAKYETPSTEPLLKRLLTNPNAEVAEIAKFILQRRQVMLELKKKPLDLKFTAADGKQVDAAKLRGKVVLVDFWASWCPPCMADAPHLVAAYQKLHDRGFEIIGICLDQDKAAMETAIKDTGMTWPQHFDGKGIENEIAQRFGIRMIPSTWLFDKTGKLRESDLRGPELEFRIENLLKEK
jgi:thiol-disulfide isomerase/thioredoxin